MTFRLLFLITFGLHAWLLASIMEFPIKLERIYSHSWYLGSLYWLQYRLDGNRISKTKSSSQDFFPILLFVKPTRTTYRTLISSCIWWHYARIAICRDPHCSSFLSVKASTKHKHNSFWPDWLFFFDNFWLIQWVFDNKNQIDRTKSL